MDKKQTNILAFMNHKGGVGKTTTALNVAYIMNSVGHSVLMVDLDPQSNLTFATIGDGDIERGVFDAIRDEKNLPLVEIRAGLFLAPSTIAMAGVDSFVANRVNNKTILARLLAPLRGHFDFILLDCPPGLNLITYNAVVACDGVIVTLTPNALAKNGLKSTVNILESVEKSMRKHTPINGVAITRYNSARNLDKMISQNIRDIYGDVVFNTNIRENVTLAESILLRRPVVDFAPRSNGAVDYVALTNEILTRNKQK